MRRRVNKFGAEAVKARYAAFKPPRPGHESKMMALMIREVPAPVSNFLGERI